MNKMDFAEIAPARTMFSHSTVKETFVTFIDLQKAFDTVDRDLLKLSLLCNGIDGDFYNAIKSIYENTTSCVRIDDLLTEWLVCDREIT